MAFFTKKKEQVDDLKAFQTLIAEQHEKEAIEVQRRGWCIQQATYVLGDDKPERLVPVAQDIYAYVYGEQA